MSIQREVRIGRVRAAHRIALAGAVSVFALAATACSSGSEVASFQRDRSVMRGDPMVAIGLRPRPQPRIDYDPRSPLVMPPQNELQTPKEELALGEQWPDDPDERRAKQEEERVEYLRKQAATEDRTRALSRNELDQWARDTGSGPEGGSSTALSGNEVRSVGILSPFQLRRGKRKEPDLTAEPERRKLTEPPSGYRKAVADDNGQVVTESQEAEASKPRRGIFQRLGF
ncbi:hypothetical protein ACKTEK_01715 [Tepidamorphus sp. 3E244]|uniref:hypothetical protein n=1 Tax=Tepidamorphus sp. 3E244 TaxID=3385498 RepID=UPI0038FCFE62